MFVLYSYVNCKTIVGFSNVNYKSTNHISKEIKQTQSSMQKRRSSQKLQMKSSPEMTL